MRCSEMEISFERCNWRLPELDAACFGMPSAASRFWCKSSRMRFPGMGQVGRIWAEQVKPSPHSAVWSFAFAGKNRNLQISDDYDACIGHHMLCVCGNKMDCSFHDQERWQDAKRLPVFLAYSSHSLAAWHEDELTYEETSLPGSWPTLHKGVTTYILCCPVQHPL